jgi:hypothetical protein
MSYADWTDVRCPSCRALLAKREACALMGNLRIQFKCSKCNAVSYLPEKWEEGATTPPYHPKPTEAPTQ